MGQIVINIPSKTNRRYNVENAEDARKLMRVLNELNGVERDSTKLTREQMQDLRDGIRATRILAKMRSTGESYSVAELRDEFRLS